MINITKRATTHRLRKIITYLSITRQASISQIYKEAYSGNQAVVKDALQFLRGLGIVKMTRGMNSVDVKYYSLTKNWEDKMDIQNYGRCILTCLKCNKDYKTQEEGFSCPNCNTREIIKLKEQK